MEIFRKTLKGNDVRERLSFPTKRLSRLEKRFRGRHAVLPLKDRNDRFWRFLCTVRGRKKSGKHYLKPVLSGDWHSFVLTNDLKVGDAIKLFEETDQATGIIHYRVELNKKINLRIFGVDIHAESILVL